MATTRKRPPARSPEEEENYMISIAVKAAEKKLLDGTASAQLICHYLKLATMKEQLEKEKLENEITLLKAKTDAIEADRQREELYDAAIRAMGLYSTSDLDEYDDEEDYYEE